MNKKTLSIAIILLMIVGSFGAIGTNSEIGNDCDCGAKSVSTINENFARGLGEIPNKGPLPPGEIIGGSAPLTSSLDWRNKDGHDWTTSVKNQGNCGSCYAFGAYGAMESCLKIKDNDPDSNIDLSEQFMVSCGDEWYETIMGCGGAYADGTFGFIEDHGAIPETCFPYTSGNTGSVPPCSDKCPNWQDLVIQVVGCGLIQQGSQSSIKNAIANYGPVSASFEVFEDFYDDYTGGIYVHTYGQSIGYHRVAIVGYNDNPGYWICKNSWGAGWGEEGWFRIAYGQCGIENEVYYIEVGDSSNLVEVTKYANQFDRKDDDWQNDGTHGMVCYNIQIWTDDDAIEYTLNIPRDTPGPVKLGAYFKAQVAGANGGPDLDVQDPVDLSWDHVKQSMGAPSTYEWHWYDLTNFDKYITSSDKIKIRIFCAWGCNTWLDSVGARYAPLPPPVPDLDCVGSLSWTTVKPGDSVTGSFTVKNIGETDSSLNWRIDSYPDWGTWSFTPSSGSGLKPGAGTVVNVRVNAPNEKEKTFIGTIKVINNDNPSDYDTVSISLTTPKSRFYFNSVFAYLQQKFPILYAFLSNFLLKIK